LPHLLKILAWIWQPAKNRNLFEAEKSNIATKDKDGG